MTHYAEVDLNGWDEEDQVVVQLEADVKYLEAEIAKFKELCRVAWERLDMLDPNSEITIRLFNGLE